MTDPAVRSTSHWEDEGRRIAASLDGIPSAVILGLDPDQSARVALGIAKAVGIARPVAIGDLTGLAMPLYEVAGGEDAVGLTDCFRSDLSLNDVARQSPTSDRLFILPAGTPPVATEEIFVHERWQRLVNGFERAGALLLLVAPLGAPGVEKLIACTAGIVAVDAPPQRIRAYTVLGTADAPLPPLPPPAAPRPPSSPRQRRAFRWAAVAAVLAIVALGGWWVSDAWIHRPKPVSDLALRQPPMSRPTAPLTVAQRDTIRLAEPAGMLDSLNSAEFAVEVVAANTLSGANSVLQQSEKKLILPAATIAPSTLGGGTVWYRVIIGAWRSRADAESMLQLLRSHDLVQRDGGKVVNVPFALLLADRVRRVDADVEIAHWRAQGLPAYGLMQPDGNARIFAGAFETAAQAAPLAVSVRDAGVAPVMAFRTGRAF